MIINFDPTPLKIVPCGKSTLAKKGKSTLTKKNNSTVAFTAAVNKILITGTFSITLIWRISPHAAYLWVFMGRKRCKVFTDTNFWKVSA